MLLIEENRHLVPGLFNNVVVQVVCLNPAQGETESAADCRCTLFLQQVPRTPMIIPR